MSHQRSMLAGGGLLPQPDLKSPAGTNQMEAKGLSLEGHTTWNSGRCGIRDPVASLSSRLSGGQFHQICLLEPQGECARQASGTPRPVGR